MSQHHSSGPHTPPAKPATSPSPSSAPAPEPYKPLAWAFPFTPADKSDGSDPMTYMKALAAAEDGFYPLGANGMWHGGIHFDQNTAKHLKQDEGIRAIADGEVVAYRLDSKYPEQDYQDGRHALYSTGFVLVRHKLQLPPPPPPKPDASKQVAGQPATAPASAAPATAGKASTASTPAAAPASSQPRPGETLTFFSLYMHLMDWNTYQSASAQAKVAQVDAAKLNMAPMPYLEGERFYRVGDKANDSQDVPKPKAPAAPPRDLIGELIQSDFKIVPEPDAPEDDTANLPPPIKGIRIRESPNGKIIGILPKGSELTVSDTDEVAKAKPGWAKIKTIKSGTPAAAVVGGTPSPHAPYGYVYAKELDAVVNPQPLDSVVVLKQPYPVKAGDVVGQLGHYLRYTEAKLLPAKPTRPLLHLEVFAGPDLEAFIQKSRARAKELPAEKTFLEISPGARLVTELAEPDQKLQPGVKLVPVDTNAKGKWVKVQPKTAAPVHGGRHAKPTYTNSGAPVWVDGSLANTTTSAIVPGWKDFPLSFSNAKGPGADFRDVFRRVDLDKAGADSTVKDDKGRAWFLVTIGAKDGSTRQGWVCEQDHPLVRMCGPWDWPGFEMIDNSSIMPVDMLKRYIHVTDQYLADESKTEFEASAATVNAGPLITNLEKAIDTDHDGKVTALELKHAQETPWMAEALSHLVVRCESEWGGGLGKWEALSPLMKKLLWLWKTEIERIGKLQWWEQVTSVEGFPKEPNPWHFHPIGIVGNFAQKSEEGCGDCAARFKKISKIILNHEGGIVDHKNDKGGLTNRGIAWPTWQKYAKEDLGVEPTVENLKALTESQAEVIYLKRFWEPKGFCQFRDDRIALMTYDWTITSGGAVTQIQKMLNSKYGAGVGEDGGLGPNTIKAINAVQDQDQLLQDIAEIRRKYYRMLVDNDSSQVVFLKGWLGRVDDCLQVKL
ncbi:glycoside hydrolase family 108 protein [Burkholderia glumae]|uniref:glycoside hydrolase family 108 protein n=1 Tax=Burkholderia glumae TaxID=337 RepID=UPI0001A4B8B7|nr:glycosyl hydrolase 108 family protein [Burkholderia glumae]ACR32974.1 EF hand domain-containing protein [Burkholderia glumae BGR1]